MIDHELTRDPTSESMSVHRTRNFVVVIGFSSDHHSASTSLAYSAMQLLGEKNRRK